MPVMKKFSEISLLEVFLCNGLKYVKVDCNKAMFLGIDDSPAFGLGQFRADISFEVIGKMKVETRVLSDYEVNG